MHTEDAAHMQGIDPGFEIQSKRHQGSKTGVLLAYEKDWCSRIFCFLKSSGTQKKVIFSVVKMRNHTETKREMRKKKYQ